MINTKFVIDCQDVYKIYKASELEVVALRGLDLSVKQGEVLGIVGSSGSGKSTLLNILAGYDAPSAGRVSVGGIDLLQMKSSEIEEYRRAVVGFIWQQTEITGWMSVFPDFTIFLVLKDLGKMAVKRRRLRSAEK